MTVDLRYAEKKAPNGYRDLEIFPFLEEGEKTRIIPCLALYGANASGKSNIVKAFSTFQTIVSEGLKLSSFQPNRLNHSFATTSFGITFSLGTNEYAYSIEYNQTAILKELLVEN
jgi:AAA15 family ATPase/GTPase